MGACVLAAVLGSSAGTAVATGIGGIVVVLVISAVFYAVGRGEDRERAGAARAAQDDVADENARAQAPAERGTRDDASGEHRARAPAAHEAQDDAGGGDEPATHHPRRPRAPASARARRRR